MSGPAAGAFDPVPATIWRQVSSLSPKLEPVSTPGQWITRYIKFRSPYGNEVVQNRQTVETTTVTIRMRRDTATETISPDMEIHHRGSVYGIVTVNPIDYATGEVEVQCIRKQPSVRVDPEPP